MTVDASDVSPQVVIVLDAVDAERVAAFWAAALRYRERDPLGPYRILVPPEGHDGVPVLVQAVPEAKAGKNRMHIDIHVSDPDREVDRLVDLGATVVGPGELGSIRWTTMSDPEGNEFCVGRR